MWPLNVVFTPIVFLHLTLHVVSDAHPVQIINWEVNVSTRKRERERENNWSQSQLISHLPTAIKVAL